MAEAEANWQYRQLLTVFHGPKFGHYLEMETISKGRDNGIRTGLGTWNGSGIPEQVLRESSALIVARWEEHLITRYGVWGELPELWRAEPDPF